MIHILVWRMLIIVSIDVSDPINFLNNICCRLAIIGPELIYYIQVLKLRILQLKIYDEAKKNKI